ncbi:8-amino-7-oxononanoate synthase [Cocleimonas flava]|uniref:8-amino-7-oxononanoate synthase n=1 Tax=Cocleimonas flava TaxID=634765 RepID=A0A4R1EPP2_9GAMM|nr:8-amino-7-oxononanoate synthase [Cocleimonas flava]TCJ83287.1 8-amino-7-oxononanoate synthase [Cocleimonas flava]
MKNDSKLIQAFLKQKQQQSLYRKPRISESAQQPLMQMDGGKYLSFCSNDYLGLANHPDLVNAFKQAADKYGVGSGSAHLISGHSIEHQKLEEALAEFTGRDRVLLFSTGYMANLGTVNALLERGDYLFADRLNHASLVDAGLLSKAKMKRYPHGDVAALERFYKNLPNLLNINDDKDSFVNSMILTDGVFSMDGDEAPLRELVKVAKQNQAWLMVDDAHGFGVLGKTGAGQLEQDSLSQEEVPVLMATLGKAAGTAGAFVAGSDDLIEYLIQTARTFIYTTAMPPSIAAATRASLKVIAEESWRRDKLKVLINQFKQGAAQLGIELMPSNTAIQPILLGSTERASKLSKALSDQGILISAIRPPTVPEGEARLRVTFSANHTEEQVDQLLNTLEKSFK